MAKKLLNLWAENGANIIDDDTNATLTLENTSTGAALGVKMSTASAPAFKFTGTGMTSALSGGSIFRAIRVEDAGGVQGWIPVMVNVGTPGAV